MSSHPIRMVLVVLLLSGCGSVPDTGSPVRNPAAAPHPPIPVSYGYEIVATYPHDPNAFTQGLIWFEDALYESTGLYGQSSLRKVELNTGQVLQSHTLPGNFFAEGITLWKDEIILLTYQEKVALVFDRKTLKPQREINYPIATEGWGLTSDGTRLIFSDGTDLLRFLDPATFRVLNAIRVTEQGKPIDKLNELEFINGQIWANIWYENRIIRIDPTSGYVVGSIDLQGLLPGKVHLGDNAVLNGIAYDSKSNRLFVTGKLWPKLFEIRVVPRQ